MWKLYLTGTVVLAVAIVANALAAQLKILSWYDFLKSWTSEGTTVVSALRWQDALWLFLIYPLVLGGAARAGFVIHGWLHD